ncbi:MAG TPA: CoA pyrophosphatase [Actinomycetota bacterium]
MKPATQRVGSLDADFADAVANALAAYDRRLVEVPERRKAAVLIPLFSRDGEPWIVLTRRTDDVPTHKGQIAFPGGGHDPHDETLWDTAVREAHEEIGLEPARARALGSLDDYPTFASGFIVSPYVADIERPDAWVMSEREISAVIELPLRALARTGRTEVWERDGIRFPMHIFELEGHYVWGVTAFILHRFLATIEGALR